MWLGPCRGKLKHFCGRYYYILGNELLYGPSFPFFLFGLDLRCLLLFADPFLARLRSNCSALGKMFVKDPQMFGLFRFFLDSTFLLCFITIFN